MAATFREVTSDSGVDENLPTGGQGIVVPSGGSTLVILQDGRGLDVRSTIPSKVYVYEFKTRQERAGANKREYLVTITGNSSQTSIESSLRATTLSRGRKASCLRSFLLPGGFGFAFGGNRRDAAQATADDP